MIWKINREPDTGPGRDFPPAVHSADAAKGWVPRWSLEFNSGAAQQGPRHLCIPCGLPGCVSKKLEVH